MGCCGKRTEDEGFEMTNDGKGNKRQYDPAFNGPIKNRSCTDVICCLIFTLYILGMIIIGIISFVWGNPSILIKPTDSQGNVCGKTGTSVAKKPYLFYFDLTDCIPTDISPSKILSTVTNCPTYQICVESCPTKNQAALTAIEAELNCKYDFIKTGWASKSLLEMKDIIFKTKQCAPYTLQSSSILSRCIPTLVGTTLSTFLSDNQQNITDGMKNITTTTVKNGNIAAAALLNLQNIGKKVIQDVELSWYWILGGLGIAMVASFLYIVIMRWVAGIMVWLTTYAVLTLIGYGVYYCYKEYDRLAKQDTSSLQFSFSTNLSSYKDKKETWLAFTIILGVILGILLLLLLALRKRIQIAIQLIKEASKSISCMMSTLFFPIIPWIMQLMLFGWFVGVLVFLVTAGSASFKKVENGTLTNILCTASEALNKLDPNSTTSCNFIEYKSETNLFRMQIYHLFGWFWLMNFIIAFGQCVLAGAFASWYWAWDKKTDVPTLPVLASMGRTLRYHTGSLAFGSLIIALIQLARAALEYLDHKLNGPGTEPGPVTKFLIKCLKCCFWCFEKCMKFLNKNAYIEIAVYGKNFCTSAKNALSLLMRNILRAAVLDKVTDFLLLIGKITITMGIAVGSFYWFKDRKGLNYYLAPVIIITVGAYMIASAFFSVYEMAIDTIFLCFLEDSERHDGSPEKPYYMSKPLKKLLGKKNKKASDSD